MAGGYKKRQAQNGVKGLWVVLTMRRGTAVRIRARVAMAEWVEEGGGRGRWRWG